MDSRLEPTKCTHSLLDFRTLQGRERSPAQGYKSAFYTVGSCTADYEVPPGLGIKTSTKAVRQGSGFGEWHLAGPPNRPQRQGAPRVAPQKAQQHNPRSHGQYSDYQVS